ncbi:hypothetical protein C8R44DRAFT_974690 [Mycena epipterygia]|nr:hypothetical protein C8R44DRAFT_974690 [Mycena epipterygia]
MARVGCVNNASIYGHQPPRASGIIVSENEKPPCPILADICPSLLHLCIFTADLRVRTSPCQRRREPACFERVREVCVESGPRSRAHLFTTDGLTKRFSPTSRTQMHKICDVESGRMRVPSSLPELAHHRRSTHLLEKGTFRCLRPSSRDRQTDFEFFQLLERLDSFDLGVWRAIRRTTTHMPFIFTRTSPGLGVTGDTQPTPPRSSRDVPDLRTIVMPLTICTSRQYIDLSCSRLDMSM